MFIQRTLYHSLDLRREDYRGEELQPGERRKPRPQATNRQILRLKKQWLPLLKSSIRNSLKLVAQPKKLHIIQRFFLPYRCS